MCMNDIDYVVVTSNNVDVFETDVKTRLAQGYALVGGVSIAAASPYEASFVTQYSQALVKGLSNNELSKSNQEGVEES